MDYVTKKDLEDALRRSIDDTEWEQAQSLLRRAQRELELLVGDLSRHDPVLVSDTLADAIREEWENPGRIKQETDGAYSYTKAILPSGQPGRFWWPSNLLDLFGVADDSRGKLRVISVAPSPAMRGWVY